MFYKLNFWPAVLAGFHNGHMKETTEVERHDSGSRVGTCVLMDTAIGISSRMVYSTDH